MAKAIYNRGGKTSEGTETDTVESVTIQIDKTNGYSSGAIKVYDSSGQPNDTKNKNISVSETLDTPFHLIRIYTHYYYKFMPGGQPKYIKMKSGLTFKNRGQNINNISVASNVRYVYVYHFGGIPILVCVVTDASSNPYKYYKPDVPYKHPFEKTTWTPIPHGTTGNDKLDENEHPNGANNKGRLPNILREQYITHIIFYYILFITVIG